MTFQLLPGFISSAEHRRLVFGVISRAHWAHSTHNGSSDMWFPEREDIQNITLKEVVDRARKKLGVDFDTAASDVIFLRYCPGDWRDKHKDKMGKYKQMRCGILLRASELGGELFVERSLVPMRPLDAVIYRNDRVEHEVTKVERGKRILLTVGSMY